MRRGALVIAVLFAFSCKKEPPKGDLPPASGTAPPATEPAAKATPSEPPAAPSQPPAAPSTPPAASTPPAPSDPAAPANPHAGMGGDPSVPGKTAPKTLEKLPDGSLALGPFAIKAPADWTAKPSTSSMRAAIFELPPKDGGTAELVVTYFGPNGAGSVQDNLNRWIDQFQQPDGKPSRDVANVKQLKFGGQDAAYVEVSGRYVAMAMPGATPAADKPDQAMRAAIVQSPKGPYYFKLVGAKATVEANAAAFRKMLESIKVR
jgi:hypothetical protein